MKIDIINVTVEETKIQSKSKNKKETRNNFFEIHFLSIHILFSRFDYGNSLEPRQRQKTFVKKIPRIHKTSHWLAVGLGSGLSPIAPGTTGTLGALLLCLLAQNHPYIIGIMLIFTLVAGPHICEIASKDFALQDKSNSHDHRNIVIDEWAGYFISVIFLPFTISNVLLAFILFRVIDITKPWPISWIDKKMNNGYGIMLDDVVAGFFTFLILYSANLLFPL